MKTAFDIASIDYDTNFTFSKIGKAQRNRVFKYLNPILSEEKLSILELNCGTREDAIKFSKNGHNVLATGYTTQNIKPIGLWIPPSYLEKSILGKKTSIKILSFLEAIFSFSFLSKYADHFLIELKPKT